MFQSNQTSLSEKVKTARPLERASEVSYVCRIHLDWLLERGQGKLYVTTPTVGDKLNITIFELQPWWLLTQSS